MLASIRSLKSKVYGEDCGVAVTEHTKTPEFHLDLHTNFVVIIVFFLQANMYVYALVVVAVFQSLGSNFGFG